MCSFVSRVLAGFLVSMIQRQMVPHQKTVKAYQ